MTGFYRDFYNVCPTCGKSFPDFKVRTRVKVKNKKTGKLEWTSEFKRQETCSNVCQGAYEDKKRLYYLQYDPNDAVNTIQRNEKARKKRLDEGMHKITQSQGIWKEKPEWPYNKQVSNPVPEKVEEEQKSQESEESQESQEFTNYQPQG